jgi:hypothetical protein
MHAHIYFKRNLREEENINKMGILTKEIPVDLSLNNCILT